MGALGRGEPLPEGKLTLDPNAADRQESARAAWLRSGGTPQECPYCGSTDTRREAVFGPFHMSETYFCRGCGSPFSRIKWREEGDGNR